MNHRTTLVLTFLFFLVAGTVDGALARGAGRTGPASAARTAATIPSVDEMAAAIDANTAQRAALAEARLAWVKAMEGPRDIGGRRGPRTGGVSGEAEAVTPPLMAFLTDASRALDVDETLALVTLFESKQGVRGGVGSDWRGRQRGYQCGQQRGQQRGQQHGPTMMHRGRPGWTHEHSRFGSSSLLDELDLSDEQREQLHASQASALGALRALRAQSARGDEPTQAQRDEAARIRAEHQSRMQSILGAEQNAAWEQLRAERRQEHASRADERFALRKATRLEFLTAVLDLDARQRQNVEAAIDASRAEATRERAERWEEGGPLPRLLEQPGPRGAERMDAARDAIREVLQPKQRELFARLQALGVGSDGRGQHFEKGQRRGHRGPGARRGG